MILWLVLVQGGIGGGGEKGRRALLAPHAWLNGFGKNAGVPKKKKVPTGGNEGDRGTSNPGGVPLRLRGMTLPLEKGGILNLYKGA